MAITKLILVKGAPGQHGTLYAHLKATGKANAIDASVYESHVSRHRTESKPLPSMSGAWTLDEFDLKLADGWSARPEEVVAFRAAVVAGKRYDVFSEVEFSL